MLLMSIVTGIGVVFLVLGLIFKTINQPRHYGCSTTGVVVDLTINSFNYNRGMNERVGFTNNYKTARYPVYEYSVRGVVYRRANKVAYYTRSITKWIESGREFPVFYENKSPSKSMLGVGVMKTLGTVFICIGLGMISLGFSMLLILFIRATL